MDNKFCLTDMELKVLERLCEGDMNKEIAHHLSITESTAKIHVKNILMKMNAKNRTTAAIIANSENRINIIADDEAQAYLNSLLREISDLKSFIRGIAKNALQAVGDTK